MREEERIQLTKSCLKRLILKPNINVNAKLTLVVFETLCVKSAKTRGYSAFVIVTILKMAHTVILEPFRPLFHYLPTPRHNGLTHFGA